MRLEEKSSWPARVPGSSELFKYANADELLRKTGLQFLPSAVLPGVKARPVRQLLNMIIALSRLRVEASAGRRGNGKRAVIPPFSVVFVMHSRINMFLFQTAERVALTKRGFDPGACRSVTFLQYEAVNLKK